SSARLPAVQPRPLLSASRPHERLSGAASPRPHGDERGPVLLRADAPARKRSGYTLLCGTYEKDGYLGAGPRSRRHLDLGKRCLSGSVRHQIEALHGRVGGELVVIGVSYSGFGVATIASHHPELRPDRLIVFDSYLDLPARRSKLPDSHETAREID